jgi:hypothetical protein
MEDSQTEVLTWFMQTDDRYGKHEFLRRLLNVMDDVDFKKAFSIISKTRKSRKKEAAEVIQVAEPAEVLQVAEPAESVGVSGSVPLWSAPIPLAVSGWLSRWRKEDVVAIDVEKVILFFVKYCIQMLCYVFQVQIPLVNPTKKHKFSQKAATIAVVDWNKNVIFSTKLFREFGSYVTTRYTVAINGIKPTTLQESDTEKPELAYKRLADILQGKLVVGIELENDLDSFEDLRAGELKTFDLQSHYHRVTLSPNGKRISEPLGLRSLCIHIFGTDPEPPGQTHQASVGAKSTMDIFKHYCTIIPPPIEKINYLGTSEINHHK